MFNFASALVPLLLAVRWLQVHEKTGEI